MNVQFIFRVAVMQKINILSYLIMNDCMNAWRHPLVFLTGNVWCVTVWHAACVKGFSKYMRN